MLVHCAKEGMWLRSFISEILRNPENPMDVDCDNQGAIALSKDNKHHQCTKPSTFVITTYIK